MKNNQNIVLKSLFKKKIRNLNNSKNKRKEKENMIYRQKKSQRINIHNLKVGNMKVIVLNFTPQIHMNQNLTMMRKNLQQHLQMKANNFQSKK